MLSAGVLSAAAWADTALAAALAQVNVTDIDDKIIKRARLNKLLADYVALGLPAAEVHAKVNESVAAFEVKMLAKLEALEKPIVGGG